MMHFFVICYLLIYNSSAISNGPKNSFSYKTVYNSQKMSMEIIGHWTTVENTSGVEYKRMQC